MSERDREQESQITRAVETAIRLGVIYLMAMWVFAIIRPFLSPVLWGIILAVAAYPAYLRLARLCRGRTTLAAALFSLIALVLLIVPTVMLTGVLVDWVQTFAERLESGGLDIPRPPAGVIRARTRRPGSP